MSDTVIRVENVGKRYRIGAAQKKPRTGRAALVNFVKSPFRHLERALTSPPEEEILWALRNVSFEVKRGEIIGIIGRNGAGKSTLLKILSRITEPTEGRAELHGRVGSLLEVGVGFNPELTGRENIYLNGAILGMSRADIRKRFDEIVAFSGVEKFLETPVKHYSSGMYVRLAFAVAAHLEPEILLVDEVLAVGDSEFQNKCLGKMENVTHEGRTVLFVSHNMAAVSRLCSVACLLESGQLRQKGPTDTIVAEYMQSILAQGQIPVAERLDRQGNGLLRFTALTLLDKQGKPLNMAVSGQTVQVALDYQGTGELPQASISIGFYGPYGQCLLWCNNELTGRQFKRLPRFGRVVCTIPRLPFAEGAYRINIYCEVNGQMADWVQEAGQLKVASGDFYGTGRTPPASHGGFLVDHAWSCEEAARP